MKSEDGKFVSYVELCDTIDQRAQISKNLRNMCIVSAIVIFIAGATLVYTSAFPLFSITTIGCGLYLMYYAIVMHRQYKTYYNVSKALPK
jgi:hypothetical protein